MECKKCGIDIEPGRIVTTAVVMICSDSGKPFRAAYETLLCRACTDQLGEQLRTTWGGQDE